MIFHIRKFSLSTRVGACVIALLGGCSKGGGDGGLEQARQHLDEGRLSTAIIEARKLLAKDSLNAQAQLLVGRALGVQGATQDAEKEIRKAERLGLARPIVDAALAHALLEGGQLRRLVDELKPSGQQHGQQHDEPAADLLTSRGHAQLGLGLKAQAAASFDAALQAVPGFVDALIGQGRLALQDNNLAKAAALIDRALVSKPRSMDAWATKADIALANGQTTEATAAYEQAIKLAPGNMMLRLPLVRLLTTGNEFDKAQAHLEPLLKSAPNHPLVNLAQAALHFGRGQIKQARESAEKAVRFAPDYVPAQLLLAETELASNLSQQADTRLRQLLQAHPDSVFVRRFYASGMLRMNQPKLALEALLPVLDQPGVEPELLALAGEAYMQSGDYAKASHLMAKAASVQPATAGGLVTLGLRQMALGDSERGLAELQKAAALDKSGGRADFVLALTQLHNRQFDFALQAAKVMQTKHPRDAMPHNLAATAYLGQGDAAAARSSLERALVLEPRYGPAAINLALLDMDQGQPDRARARLEAVLATDNGNVDAMTALARLSGKPTELVRLLERARSMDGKALGARAMLVRQHLLNNNVGAALEVARELQTAAPDEPEALAVLGAAQFAAGLRQDAVATYTRLVAQAPNSASAHFRLGQAQAEMQNVNAAEAAYTKAMVMSPDYPDPVASLVRLYARNGRADDALKLAEDLRKRAPKSPMAEELKGDVWVQQNKFAQAARAYDAAFVLAPSGAMAVKQHGAQRRAGGRADGSRLAQWLKAHPEDHATRQYLADQQLQSGEFATAAENFRKVIELQPGNAFAMNNLANTYHLQKDPRALATAQAALALSPDNANIMDTVGLALTESGAAAQALPVLKRAVSLNPEVVEYRIHLASALAHSGDKAGARAEVKRLLDAGKPVQLDAATRDALK